MLQTIGEIFSRAARRITPNPFAFAILLTIVVAVIGIAATDNGPVDMAVFWYRGFWDLLTFSMQIVVILVTGHVVATSPQARLLIARLSELPKTSGQAILLIAAVAIIAGYLNWGIGLVTGAVMAITVSASARARGIPVHFPLAAAAGYMGLLIFGNGFSSSAPLLVNTEGHFLVEHIGLVPLSETILTPFNLITTVAFLAIMPFLLRAMHPDPEKCQEVDPRLVDEFQPDKSDRSAQADPDAGFVQRMERSRTLSTSMGLIGLAVVLWFLLFGGGAVDLNSVNFLLVMTAMVLYRSPLAIVEAVGKAVHTASGVILQFPFYSGIMGMMTLSGLVEVFASGMVSISTPTTLPLTALVSSAFVNLFVPSAGGQWAVQGPIVVEAARALEVPVGQMIMAFAYGEQLTNMIQPFWAIPLLGITALDARDLLGYTAIAMIVGFVIFGTGVTVLPLLLGP